MKQEFLNKRNIYFLGIGGIGMSALARLFKHQGKNVAGYDKTRTPLTDALISEGIAVHFEDDVNAIPAQFKNVADTLVIYTPAVPSDHTELNFFRDENFEIIKRAKALGVVGSGYTTIAVAGTHGKTTTSTLTAHILKQSTRDVNAILGGISSNYNSNLILSEKETPLFVTEADEYDRSFLQLNPYNAVITSIDPDHLDIYGSHEEMKQNYIDFAKLCTGKLFLHHSVFSHFSEVRGARKFSYGQEGDFSAKNIRVEQGDFYFDLHFEGTVWKDIRCGVPGTHNVENAVAAIAAVLDFGLSENEVRNAIASFKGVKRRFEYIVKKPDLVYIDDYAHHPAELEACINSVKKLYPGKKILGIFQPHLYSRTRDFADGFAESLSLLDEVILMDIYPAREKPIPGVSSVMVFENISTQKTLTDKTGLMGALHGKQFDVILTLGAGDIDTFVTPIKEYLES